MCFDGSTLADLLELEQLAAARAAAAYERPFAPDGEKSDSELRGSNGGGPGGANKLAQHMALFRGVGRMLGVKAVANKEALRSQLEQLAVLRAEVIAKLGTHKARESLLELRKYRRPPRVAAQVCPFLSSRRCLRHVCLLHHRYLPAISSLVV